MSVHYSINSPSVHLLEIHYTSHAIWVYSGGRQYTLHSGIVVYTLTMYTYLWTWYCTLRKHTPNTSRAPVYKGSCYSIKCSSQCTLACHTLLFWLLVYSCTTHHPLSYFSIHYRMALIPSVRRRVSVRFGSCPCSRLQLSLALGLYYTRLRLLHILYYHIQVKSLNMLRWKVTKRWFFLPGQNTSAPIMIERFVIISH